MKWKEWFLGLGLLCAPIIGKAQEAEEYPEYWQEEIERKTKAGTNIDWNFWKPWEFYVEGGSWRIVDDIAIEIKKIYLDSLVDPLPPDDLPGKELKRYYLVVDASFRALNGKKTLDPASDFLLKDENGRELYNSAYEGRDVNGYPRLGKRVSMYEKLNPGKLKRIYPNGSCSDEITVGASREFVVSRKICFPIGENERGEGRKIDSYFDGNVWLCYGRGFIPLINIKNVLREGYYEIKRELRELSQEEIFTQTMSYVLELVASKRPDLAVSYKKLDSFSFRSIERRNSGIDSVTHYFKELVPISENCFKIILLNHSHYYDSFSKDSLLVYFKNGEIRNIKVFDEDGRQLDLEDAIENF